LSSFFSSRITSSPMRALGISRSAQVQQLLLDALHRASICSVLTGRLRSASSSRRAAWRARSRCAAAVLLDDRREGDVGPLVGGEALLAVRALAAAADEVPVLGHAVSTTWVSALPQNGHFIGSFTCRPGSGGSGR
jgi:hypothetical protein